MFGFGKKKSLPEKIETINSDIFSADQAKQMVVDALIKKRNANRTVIFNGIKSQINGGSKTYLAQAYLFEDGNDVYFEGLGYKIKQKWYDNYTGEFFDSEPQDTSTNPIEPQLGVPGIGGIWGPSQIVIPSTSRNRSYQSYIQISWE